MFMTDLADVADQCAARAAEMRTLARGVFGTEERASLMEFIADYERLARAMNAKDIRVLTPVRNGAEPGLWSPPSKH
jgi:hypothetical protein